MKAPKYRLWSVLGTGGWENNGQPVMFHVWPVPKPRQPLVPGRAKCVFASTPEVAAHVAWGALVCDGTQIYASSAPALQEHELDPLTGSATGHKSALIDYWGAYVGTLGKGR